MSLPKEANCSLDEYVRSKNIRENIAIIEMRRRKNLAGAIDRDYLNFELDQLVELRKEPQDYVNKNLDDYIKDANISPSNSSSSSPATSKFDRLRRYDRDSDQEDQEEDEILKIEANDEDIDMEDINVKTEPSGGDMDGMERFVTIEAANNVKVASQQWRLKNENLKDGLKRLGFVQNGPTTRLRRSHSGRFGQYFNRSKETTGDFKRKSVSNIIQGAELHGNFIEKGNLTYKLTGADSNEQPERIIAIDRKIKAPKPRPRIFNNAGGPRPFNNVAHSMDAAPPTPHVAPIPINYITNNNFYINDTKKEETYDGSDSGRFSRFEIPESQKSSANQLLIKSFEDLLKTMKKNSAA